MNSITARRIAVVLLAALPLRTASAQKLTGPNSTIAPPDAVELDTTGMFRAKFVKVGDDVFIGGQPTEKALRALRAQGVTTVVNLRTPEEMTKTVNFDEAALAASLGMKYVYLPMRGNAEFPYTPKAVQALAAAMRDANGKLLLHCTIAWRASHLWAAYLIQERHVPVETALRQTRAINLMDDMRMSDKQPLDEFVGHPVPGLGHPGAVQSPPAPPGGLTASARSDYATVRDYFVRAAEKMPEEKYGFRPTPEVRSFGQQVAHVADDQYNLCAPARGETRNVAYTDIEKRLSAKTDLVKALKEAFAYCDAAYNTLTDESGAQASARSGRNRFAMLNWNLWHTWEHYGNVVVYLRINGIVPPSSEMRGGM
jgi:uncharacterized protein (TIGR01244 family)